MENEKRETRGSVNEMLSSKVRKRAERETRAVSFPNTYNTYASPHTR